MRCVNEESHSFTCQPHVYLNHTCLYYLVAELYHPLSGIHRPAEDRRLSRPRWPGGKLVTSTKYLLTYTHSHTTQVGRYQKGETNLDFTEARDSKWQWHQLGYV